MNCMLVGHRDRWVMVDCGVQFVPPTLIGAERIVPDLDLIARLRDKVEAVVITHGHEDHIGALPWVLPKLDPATPVYASDFTTTLIRHRLAEHDAWQPDRMRPLAPGTRFQAGPFDVQPIRVTHSLPDCASLVLRCEDGTIVHTGDWKIDEQPMDGEHFDRAAFEAVGDEGTTLLLSDSTNILSAGRTRSETTVAQNLLAEISAWPGRVIVTQFASNLHRLRGLGQAAVATGRRLVLVGRSLHRYLEVGLATGRAPFDPSILAPRDALADLDPAKTLVVTTGSQGETRAALSSAADGSHPHLKIGPGDLVLHSARLIPGNEGTAYDMFNRLAMRGARIVAGRGTAIHASGHARADELAELIGLLRPGHFVPVHGEYTFLQAHADLARTLKVPGVTLLRNGETLGLRAGRTPGHVADAARVADEPLTRFYNDGPATGDHEAMRLKERKKIAWNGVAVVDLAIQRAADDTRRATANVRTLCLWQDDDNTLPARLALAAERAITQAPPGTPHADLEAIVALAVRRAARQATGKRPEVIVVMHESAPS